jgi:eukaryotic-like serine/threonine-protein kinase
MTLRDDLQTALGPAYRLDREIGGGMSHVFLADEVALGRKVVVKLLATNISSGFSEERFAREAKLAARLQDPHIVPVLASGFANGVPWYTMPYVEGESLRHRMDTAPPLEPQESQRILRDVAVALEYAHGKGVVHRDIKPENVLLSARSAVVTDFGIAMAMDAALTHGDAQPDATRLTDIGVTLGTPAYMAPEQAAGDSVDPRADLYAWGVIAYELLAGEHPFGDRKGARQLVTAHLTETPKRLSGRTVLSAAVVDLVTRCLAKNPDERPRSAAELISVLDSAAVVQHREPAPGDARVERRRAVLLYGVSLAVVAAIARAAVAWLGVPDWVFPGALAVMGAGLPVMLLVGARQGWQRAAAIGPVPAVGFAVLVAAFMTLRALGIGPPGTLLAAGTFGNREPLLVADFRVAGADSSLGGVVAEAVRSDMAQSPVVSVVGASAVAAALTRMRKPAESTLDSMLAHVIAQREGIKGVITGDVKPLGQGYVVTVRLTAGATGDELASFRGTADAPRELIPVIDALSRKLRGKIGESLLAVRSNPPLGKVTTSSLEALRLYAAGVRANSVFADFDESVTLLRRAIAIDTSFAMAYVKLAGALQNGRRSAEEADSAITNAYRHRDRLTETERLFTTANYFIARNDRRRAAAALQLLLDRDSLDAPALNAFATQLRFLREFARAESISRRAIRADSSAFFNYAGVIIAQIDQGHMADAKKTAAAIAQRQAGFPRMDRMRFLLFAAERRLDSVEAPLTRMAQGREPGGQVEGMEGLAALAAATGRAAEAERLFGKAAALRAERGTSRPFSGALDSARLDTWVLRQPERAARVLDAALTGTTFRSMTERQHASVLAIVALMAIANKPDRARSVLALWESRADTAARRMNLAAFTEAKAELALAEGEALDAVALFRAADAQPEGAMAACIVICTSAQLARAFDRAELPDSAIAWYEQYVSTPYHLRLFEDAWHLAPSHERLAQLYEARGDRARAERHYRRFVELWSRADPELQPRVAAARQHLARLGTHQLETARP